MSRVDSQTDQGVLEEIKGEERSMARRINWGGRAIDIDMRDGGTGDFQQ
jgi:7,8-dihydro-6-hydroxymethylpterin-pyrophosphokinase